MTSDLWLLCSETWPLSSSAHQISNSMSPYYNKLVYRSPLSLANTMELPLQTATKTPSHYFEKRHNILRSSYLDRIYSGFKRLRAIISYMQIGDKAGINRDVWGVFDIDVWWYQVLLHTFGISCYQTRLVSPMTDRRTRRGGKAEMSGFIPNTGKLRSWFQYRDVKFGPKARPIWLCPKWDKSGTFFRLYFIVLRVH